MVRSSHPARVRAARGLPAHMPFLQTDLDRWEHPKISDKATVKLLAEWSEYFTQHGFDQVDMTDNNVLWGYLCARPDARVIVGPGICTLAVMRLRSINPNKKQLCIDVVARRFVSQRSGSTLTLRPRPCDSRQLCAVDMSSTPTPSPTPTSTTTSNTACICIYIYTYIYINIGVIYKLLYMHTCLLFAVI